MMDFDIDNGRTDLLRNSRNGLRINIKQFRVRRGRLLSGAAEVFST